MVSFLSGLAEGVDFSKWPAFGHVEGWNNQLGLIGLSSCLYLLTQEISKKGDIGSQKNLAAGDLRMRLG
jgi:hypothetical protein